MLQSALTLLLKRKQHPGRAFILPIPAKKLRDAHQGDDEHQMIYAWSTWAHLVCLWYCILVILLTLSIMGCSSVTVGISHREAVERALNNHQSVKVIDSIPLTNSFIERFLSLLEHA